MARRARIVGLVGLAVAAAVGSAFAQDVNGYVYDATGRLIGSTQALAPPAAGMRASSYTRYSFDDADNLTERWVQPVAPLTSPDRLASGEAIVRGQRLVAGTVRLEMQHDGNVVLYCGSAFRWATNTDTGRATTLLMETDGALSVLGPGAIVWQQTTGSPGARLVLGSGGSLVLENAGGQPLVTLVPSC